MEAAKSKVSSNLGFLTGIQSSTNPQSSNPFLRSLSKPGGTVRNHIIAFCGEFIGTFLFLFFAFTGTQVANSQTQGTTSTSLAQGSNPAQLLYISLCFGFSLAVNAWVFFRISGGLFNPAVTFGMCLINVIPWLRGLVVFIAQLTGSMTAAAVVSALFPGPFNVRTTLGAGTSEAQGLFIEMFLTAMLVLTIFMLAAEKHKGTFIAPVGIGLALFIAELSGVYYTGGSLNPARSFGPDVVVRTFESYHWIYWLGPALGSLLASTIYTIFKALNYTTANPGQDFDENETVLFDPERGDVRRPSPLTHIVVDTTQDEGDTDDGGNTNGGGGEGVRGKQVSLPTTAVPVQVPGESLRRGGSRAFPNSGAAGDGLSELVGSQHHRSAGLKRKREGEASGIRGGGDEDRREGQGFGHGTGSGGSGGSGESSRSDGFGPGNSGNRPTGIVSADALMPMFAEAMKLHAKDERPLAPLGMHTPNNATKRSLHEEYGGDGVVERDREGGAVI